jgi:hypothetical protein
MVRSVCAGVKSDLTDLSTGTIERSRLVKLIFWLSLKSF